MPQNNPFNPFKAFSGSLLPAQLEVQGSQWVSERHGRYYASAYGTPARVSPATAAVAGSFFRGSNQTGATLSAGLATTYTGLCLSNPATPLGSAAVNLIVRYVTGTIIIAPAGELALGLITGWLAAGVTVHTTPLNTKITPAYVGAAPTGGSIAQPASGANLDAACTIVGTPLWDRWIAAGPASTNNVSFYVDLGDDTIIPPGGYIAIGANATGPSAGFLGTYGWEELPP